MKRKPKVGRETKIDPKNPRLAKSLGSALPDFHLGIHKIVRKALTIYKP